MGAYIPAPARALAGFSPTVFTEYPNEHLQVLWYSYGGPVEGTYTNSDQINFLFVTNDYG